MLAGGCTTREIVVVEIGVVTLHPNTASLLDGQSLQFTAIVTDADGTLLQGATVTWTTDNPGVVSIDSTGVLRALGQGTARVYGSFGGVEGTALVSVLAGPTLVLSPDSVVIGAAAGAPPPAPVIVQLTVEGQGTIAGLEATSRFAAGQPGGWLTASFAGTTAPTSLTLTTQTSSLAPGAYSANVVIESDFNNDSTLLPVSLVVTLGGVRLAESGGSTSVTESGSSDSFTVVLEARPGSDVVLDVRSADETEVTVSPSRLTFTPSSWSTPRAVVVTGKNDTSLDGNVTTTVSVTVVDALSDPTYALVPDATIMVTTLDDERASFTVRETGGRTRMREGNDDELRVELDVRPTSNVVIDVRSDDLGEATVFPATLTFTPGNWDQEQVVTVRGVEDNVRDGTQTTDVTFSVNEALSDPGFRDAPDQTVEVVTLDDDD